MGPSWRRGDLREVRGALRWRGSGLLSLLQSSLTQETTTAPELPSETQETPGPALCR